MDKAERFLEEELIVSENYFNTKADVLLTVRLMSRFSEEQNLDLIELLKEINASIGKFPSYPMSVYKSRIKEQINDA